MDVVSEMGEWKQGSEWMCLKLVNGNKGVSGCFI